MQPESLARPEPTTREPHAPRSSNSGWCSDLSEKRKRGCLGSPVSFKALRLLLAAGALQFFSVQQADRIRRGKRAAIVETLSLIATMLHQQMPLRFVLDAFRDHLKSQACAKTYESPNNSIALPVF